MRSAPFLFVLTVMTLVPAVRARAQVSDAERAGARELFKAGDQLQRAGHFAEALDKFQRAQQVFGAPTNLLRIAECEAALGRLVESAETYRVVVRTPLPPASPPAFEAAVDQAKAELAQVEPRVPKLIVEVQPTGVQSPQMRIDGQNVPGALIGEPMSLDSGIHNLVVFAPGYAGAEQQVELKEHDSKTVSFVLNAVSGVTYAPAGSANTAPLAGPMLPPPPPIVAADIEPPEPPRSRFGLLFGLHLGGEVAGGSVPTNGGGGAVIDASSVGAGGLAFGLDGGIRFARHWYVGLTLDHADFSSGTTGVRSNTTLFAAMVGLIVNPERVSFYGEIGLGTRWFTDHGPNQPASAGDLTIGAGIWIPTGRAFRIVPKISLGLSSFGSSPNDGTESSAVFATFGMLGVSGFYNLDL